MRVEDLRDSRVFGTCRSVYSYEKMNRIGEGTYGTVYRAIDKQTDKVVALKKVILHNEQQDGFPLTSLREVSVLKAIRHANCVKLLDVVVGKRHDSVFLVFEYCEHDLQALLSAHTAPFSESEAKTLMLQLLSAIAYLHDHFIIHRDIKLSNLLYNNRGQLKLADFGLARKFSVPEASMTNKVVTLWYRAPEVLLGLRKYSTAIDIWACGCIMGELLLYTPLMPGNDEIAQLESIFKLLGAPSEAIWPGLRKLPLVSAQKIDLSAYLRLYPLNNLALKLPKISEQGLQLINVMLTYNPDERIKARDVLSHPYFEQSPYPKEDELMPTFPTRHTRSGDPRERLNPGTNASKRSFAASYSRVSDASEDSGRRASSHTSKRRRN